MSQEFGQNEHENPKFNTVRGKIDWAGGYMKKMKLHSKVIPHSNGAIERQFAEYRNMQLMSQMEACRAQRQIDRAITDCLITGEGILRVKMKTITKEPLRLRSVVHHKSWKNVYYDRANEGIQEARYLFNLSWQPAKRLAERFPQHASKIMQFGTFILNDRSINQADAHEFRTSDINPEEEYVAFGEAWWRVVDKDYPDGKVVYAPIIANEALDEVYLIEKPRNPYNFNKFPFVSIVADRYKRDGCPYSPLLRHAIGIEKVKQYVLREIIKVGSRRGAVIDKRAFPKGGATSAQSIYETINGIKKQLSHSDGLAVVDSLDGIEFHHGEKEMAGLLTLFNTLETSSNINGMQIDPALLGSSSNITAAIAIQEKGRHADLSLTKPINSYQAAIEDIGEIMLAMIAQGEKYMEFPAFINNDGEVNSMDMAMIHNVGADGRRAIESFKFSYRVAADQSQSGHEQEQLRLLSEVAKTNPELGGAIVMLSDRIVPMGYGIKDDLAEMFLKSGKMIPTSRMSERVRQVSEQLQMSQQQEREQQEQMQRIGFMSEIEETNANAEAMEADARYKDAKTEKTIVETKLLPLELLAQTTENPGQSSPLDQLS